MSRSRWIIRALVLVAAVASCVGADPGDGSLTEAVGSGSSSPPDAGPPPVSTPTPDAVPATAHLTWQQCAAGGGNDYFGATFHGDSECRGACGINCAPGSCSDWSPCTNGQQFRTCWTMPFCRRHDKCYDCCADNGYSTVPGSQCALGCDANCQQQYHPPCKYPQVCTFVSDANYGSGSGSGSGSNGSPSSLDGYWVCVQDPRDAPNCGKHYTLDECFELADGITDSFDSETSTMQFNRSCAASCVPDGSCSAPPCGTGVDNCGNGCTRTDGCGGGSGSGSGS